MRVDLSVLDASPDAGDPVLVDGLVADLLARGQRFEQRATEVRAAGQELAAACTGAWVDALVGRVDRLCSGWQDAAGGCAGAAGVLAGYGEQLRVLTRRVMTCRHEVGTARIRALRARDRYEAEVLAAGGPPTGWSWTDVPPFPTIPGVGDALVAWRTAVGDVVRGLADFEACCREREDLDRSAAAALSGLDVMHAYAPGTTPDVVIDLPLVEALTAAAAGTSTTRDREVLAEWFTRLAAAVVDDPTGAGSYDVLIGFLDAQGDDAGLMSTVFAALGGAGTLRLVTSLGRRVRPGDHAENAALARSASRIREALAAASSEWSDAEARTFAGQMFSDVATSDGAIGVVAFLFADRDDARMGMSFTLAMADLIDAREREQGPMRDSATDPGSWLVELDTGVGGEGARDVAAEVLATLGEYPQVARDWLTGERKDWSDREVVIDGPRVAYWFGERDWSPAFSDGFAGVGALWAGVQDLSDGGDARQLAALNDSVFYRLARNPVLLHTELVSAAGSEQLARVLAPQLAGLVEVGAMRNPQNRALAWESVVTPVWADGVVTAAVARAELVRVLAAAASEAPGRVVLQDALLGYQAEVLTAVASGEASADQALDRIAVIWGVADGALDGATQAELQRASDTVREALGIVRVPVDVGLAFVPNPVVGLGLGIAVDQLEQLAVQRPAPEDPGRVVVRPDGMAPMTHFFTSAVLTYQHVGLWDQPTVRVDTEDLDSAIAHALDYVQRYEDVAGAMSAEAAQQPIAEEEGER